MKFHYDGKSNSSGVYKITNIQNGRIYIGSAKRFKERWSAHLNNLEKGTHANKFLQRDFNKCGTDSFEISIIEIVDGSKEKRLLVEGRYLLHYHDKCKQCYNIRKLPTSNGGVSKTSEETRKKMSSSRKKYWSIQENKDKQSKISKKIWSTKSKQFKQENLQRMLEGRTETLSNEHKAKIKETSKRKYLKLNPKETLFVSEEQIALSMSKDKFNSVRNKKVQIENLITNQVIICCSISMASRIIQTNTAALMAVLKNQREHYKYWKITYLNEETKE